MQRRNPVCFISADQTIGASAQTSITGLALTLPDAGSYRFQFDVLTSSSAAATLTAQCTCSVATAFSMFGLIPIATTADIQSVNTGTIATPTNGAARTTTATNYLTSFVGYVTVSSTGILQLQMATSVSSLTVRAGSCGMAVQV